MLCRVVPVMRVPGTVPQCTSRAMRPQRRSIVAKKRTRRSGGSRGARRHGGRSGSLSGVATSVLQEEIERRQSVVQELEAKQARLLEEAEEIGQQIAMYAVGGSSARSNGRRSATRGTNSRARRASSGPAAASRTGSRKRPRNDMNLVEALAKLLKGRTMSVTDMTAAVQKAGYKTTSPNFRTIVNQTLLKSDRFKKVARGQYTAK